MSYVPLWCRSNFSFLDGASHPDELVEQAHALGIEALALTDRDGVYGIVRAHVKARELGVRLIVGAEVTVGDAVADAGAVVRGGRSRGGLVPAGDETDAATGGAGAAAGAATGETVDGGSGAVGAAEARAGGASGDRGRLVAAGDHGVPTSTIVLLAADRTGYANLCRLITTGRLRRPKGESCVTWPEVCERAEGLVGLWGGERSLLVREAEPRGVAGPLREAFGDRLYAVVSRHRRAEEV